jgi:hypothetical protein
VGESWRRTKRSNSGCPRWREPYRADDPEALRSGDRPRRAEALVVRKYDGGSTPDRLSRLLSQAHQQQVGLDRFTRLAADRGDAAGERRNGRDGTYNFSGSLYY